MKLLTFPATRSIVVAATTAVLCASVQIGAPAHADTIAITHGGAQDLSEHVLTELQNAIDESDTFDGAAAESGELSTTVVDEFATGWVAAGRSAINLRIDAAEVTMIENSAIEIRGCVGRNRADYTGLQVNAYLDSCNTTRVLGLIGSAVGVATIAGVITAITGAGVVVAGVLAAALTVAGGVLTNCSAAGRGVVVHNIPPTAAIWCNGQ